jgi:anaerobic magnesium-protoporphyrin IX monomethyl ester cyclase
MKIMLISPPVTLHEDDVSRPTKPWLLGLGYMAAVLEHEGYDVRILDCFNRRLQPETGRPRFLRYGFSDDMILQRVAEYSPDVIGVSCMFTPYLKDAHHIARLCKQYNSMIPVIFGGAHASTFPEYVLKDENVDCVVVGEGENTMLDLVKRIEHGEGLTGIPGTMYRRNGQVRREQPRPFIENLDELPFPAWHLLDKEGLVEEAKRSPFVMRRPVGAMVTSRGCPNNCYFCSVRKIWGRKWRARSPENVVDEMEFLKNVHGFQEIQWVDDNCGVSKRRLEEICDEIMARKLDVKWVATSGIAHWTLDQELLDKMKRAGCYRLIFGIESGDEETRKIIRKTYSLSQAKRVTAHANKIGMWTAASFIIGFPHETKKEIDKTISVSKWLGLDLPIFYLLIPQPGTDVYEIFKGQGLLDLDRFLDPTCDDDEGQLGREYGNGIATRHFTRDELQEHLSRAYRSFFYHRIRSLLVDPFQLVRKVHSWEDLRYLVGLMMTGLRIFARLLSLKTGVVSPVGMTRLRVQNVRKIIVTQDVQQ